MKLILIFLFVTIVLASGFDSTCIANTTCVYDKDTLASGSGSANQWYDCTSTEEGDFWPNGVQFIRKYLGDDYELAEVPRRFK